MENKPYYLAYEKRYKTVYESGAERWGHSLDDEELYTTLKAWVEDNHLKGKSIVEFACGEGASGVILSELGCHYTGFDISSSAVKKANNTLRNYPNARADIFDMVKQRPIEKYDAALDCMGLHMLVTDGDRQAYLKNAFWSLKDNAPMLFYKEAYRDDKHRDQIVKSPVGSYEEWLKITGDDYDTPFARKVDTANGELEVMLPLVPSRANDRSGYMNEMRLAGFTVERFIEMESSKRIQYSASIYVRKP